MSDFNNLTSVFHVPDLPHCFKIRAPISSPSPTTSFGNGSSSNPTDSHVQEASSNGAGGQSSDTKKHRGRQARSRTKLKKTIMEKEQYDVTKSQKILEISNGSDVIKALINYARQFHVCVNVHSCVGSISGVALRHQVPNMLPLILHGPFNVVSFSGLILCDALERSSFAIVVAGMQGQVFAGRIYANVIAAGSVMVVASTLGPIHSRSCRVNLKMLRMKKVDCDDVAALTASGSYAATSFLQSDTI